MDSWKGGAKNPYKCSCAWWTMIAESLKRKLKIKESFLCCHRGWMGRSESMIKTGHLYSAFLWTNSSLKRSGMARVNEESHSLTCHPHVYPQMEWAILSLIPFHSTSPHFGRYSFPIPQRVGGWVDLDDWLHTGVDRRWSPIPVPTDLWCGCRGLNSRPLSRVSDDVTTRLPSHGDAVCLQRGEPAYVCICTWNTCMSVCVCICVCVSVCLRAAFVDCQSVWWQVGGASRIQQPRQRPHLSWQFHCGRRVLSVRTLQILSVNQ